MRISWNWLSELVDLNKVDGPKGLAELLTARGLEVEAIERQDHGFAHVIVAQILEFQPHPQADRLNLCQVSTGQGSPIEIVCGARNVKAGAKVALAQVGAHLPNDLKIVVSKIRGVISNGMLCSEEELKLLKSGDKSDGILILPDTAELGMPLAKFLGRDDVILTLKLTANRGDCLSHFGIAREVAAALRVKPKRPEGPTLPFGNSPISVALNTEANNAPRFFGCAIEGVKIGPSPEWLSRRLEALGSRSISNVVDATNLIMLELGQPMHAYDADKILGRKLQVRTAKKGETLPLLDGQTIELDGFELVIADEERAVALAGVMGGGNSEVQSDSVNLFLECAEFSPVLVRRAASRHQHKTDASHRFERGVDPQGLSAAISRLAGLIVEVAGGKIVGSTSVHAVGQAGMVDSTSLSGPGKFPEKFLRSIRFGVHYLPDFLGFRRENELFKQDSIEEILRSLDCEVQFKRDEWVVTPPSYRLDLNIKEDIAEEIARSIGYDQIPATIPPLSSSPVFAASSLLRLSVMDRAKESLVRSGLFETVNFSFTSKAWLSRFGLTSTVSVLNPLSEEYSVMVPSLLPGLLQNARDNWSHHFGSESLAIRLFELRPVFSTSEPIHARGQMETGVQEKWKLAFLISGPRYAGGLRCEQGEVDFYDLRAVVDSLLTTLGTKGVRYQPLSASRTGGNAMYHPGQSVELLVGNSVAGYFGLLHPALSKDMKARAPLWMAELDWEILTKLSRKPSELPTFVAWPQFPAIERDFALIVKNDVTADKLCQLALKTGKPLAKIAKVFDIYRGNQVAEGMTSVAVRVIFYNEERSLQEPEAEAASVRILESWKKELGVELRS